MSLPILSRSGVRTSPAPWLKQFLIAAALLLILRVLIGVLWDYRWYFPADFDRSPFLGGRRPTFQGWYKFAFYTHIITSPVALVLGLALLMTGLRRQALRIHRSLGKIQVLLLVLGVAPSGAIMATHSQGGSIAGWGFASQSLLTVTTALVAVYYVRRGQLTAHQQWAIRCVLLLLAPLLLRLATGLAFTLNVESLTTYQASAWLSWIVPLLMYEVVRARLTRSAQSGAQRSIPANSTSVNFNR